jgi:hypothetical protein
VGLQSKKQMGFRKSDNTNEYMKKKNPENSCCLLDLEN